MKQMQRSIAAGIILLTVFAASLIAGMHANADPKVKGRGVNYAPTNILERDRHEVESMMRMNIRLIRYFLPYFDDWARTVSPDVYKYQVMQDVTYLRDVILPITERSACTVIVVLGTPPGGRLDGQTNSPFRMMTNATDRATFISLWQQIASTLKGNRVGYDLVNEPRANDSLVWRTLAIQTTKAIRMVDAVSPILVEPLFGDPKKLTATLFPPLPASYGGVTLGNIVYSVHFYYPGNYVFNGMPGYNPDTERYWVQYPYDPNRSYPTDQNNRDTLERNWSAALTYKQQFGVELNVGEFGLVRWGKGVYWYLRDLINLMERERMSWTFLGNPVQRDQPHTWNLTLPGDTYQWWYENWDLLWAWGHGFSPEEVESSYRSLNLRETLLRAWYSRNVHPPFRNPQTGHVYWVVDANATYDILNFVVVNLTENQRWHLAYIESAAERQFVVNSVGGFLPLFDHVVGARLVNGRWRYQDGRAVTYTFWGPGQPDNYRGSDPLGEDAMAFYCCAVGNDISSRLPSAGCIMEADW